MIGLTQNTVIDSKNDWTFRSAETKQVTHGIHRYPATMIPQIAKRLIKDYGHEGAFLFDPYCGSGTTLLEGFLAGLISYGTDLNPLARLIARVKSTPVNLSDLDNEIKRFKNMVPRLDIHIPEIPNIDFWFSPEIQRDLAGIRHYIDQITNKKIAEVFRVAFSLTVRNASWTRNSEFKLYRMSQRQMDKHDPQPFSNMLQSLVNIRKALQVLNKMVTDDYTRPVVYDFNTVSGIPTEKILPGSIDLVVTSPPYGDSRTTVAYGQFSRLPLQWLGYKDASRIDSILMGGEKISDLPKFDFQKLDRTILNIAKMDESRARDVSSFFQDYRTSISNVATTIAHGGYACYVVGNRTVKGYTVPTAEATAAFFEKNGFRTVDICYREIPNKQMPSVNSPSNVPGEVGQTMTKEQITICRKVR